MPRQTGPLPRKRLTLLESLDGGNVLSFPRFPQVCKPHRVRQEAL